MLDCVRWNRHDSLLISFELCFMNGNESLIDEDIKLVVYCDFTG